MYFLREIFKIKDYDSFKKKEVHFLRKENMFSLLSLSKSKFFTYVVSFVSYLCHSRVALVPYLRCSCRICVTRVAVVLLVSGTRVVKESRSEL